MNRCVEAILRHELELRGVETMSRSIEAILHEVQEVQTVKNRAADLIADCDKRMEELKQELDRRSVNEGLKIVLNGTAYEFSDAGKAHNALDEAADEDYLACTRDGVYWMGRCKNA